MEPAPHDASFDPVHSDQDGWWFWDETQADRLGPYDSEEEARERLEAYVSFLEHGPSQLLGNE